MLSNNHWGAFIKSSQLTWHIIIYPHFGFSFLIFSISPLPSIVLPLFLPHLCPMPSLGEQPAESAYRTRPQPASELLPVCAWGCDWGQPVSPSLISHLLYLSAGSLPSTHAVLLHLPGEPGRTKKGDNTSIKSIERVDSCWGQACSTSAKNSHGYPDRHMHTVPLIQRDGCPTQSHQRVCLKAADSVVGHQSISPFTSTEGIVFEVISLCHCILYQVVMTWVTQYEKHKNGGTKPVLPPW